MSDVKFNDYSIEVKGSITEKIGSFLVEASREIVSQTVSNSRRKTGQTAGSFDAEIDESAGRAVIGSDYENAIWEEFGTGIYAINGDGRKNVPWRYQDERGVWHKTSGKTASRAFFKAFQSSESKIIARAKEVFSSL